MARFMNPGLVVLALLGSVGFPGCAHHPPPPPPEHAHMGAPPECADDHGEAMAQRRMQIEDLVDAMNAAQGPAKVDAMAAVVNELAREHIEMHHRMHEMHHPMQPMRPGGPPQ